MSNEHEGGFFSRISLLTVTDVRREIEAWKRSYTALSKRYDDLAAADAAKAKRIASLEHVVAQQAADHLELTRTLMKGCCRITELEAALAHTVNKAPDVKQRNQMLVDALDLRTDELKTALARNVELEKKLAEKRGPTGTEIEARKEADKTVIAFYETHMKISAWISHFELEFAGFKRAMMSDYDMLVSPEGDAKAAEQPDAKAPRRPSTAGAMGMGKRG